MSVASEKLNLPPNVIGKTRGYLDLAIENIIWKTSKTFNTVKVELLWWGQNSDGISCEGIKINVNKSQIPPEEPLRTIRYQIKTNSRLFLSYLKNCEPLKVEIYSSKTGDFIGSSKVEIPLKFHNSPDVREQSCRLSLQILSTRQFSLGEIVVSIHINQSDAMTHKNSTKLKDTKRTKSETSNVVEPAALKEKDSNKENIRIVGSKMRISFRDPKPLKPSTLIKFPQKENSKPARILKSARKASIEQESRPEFHSSKPTTPSGEKESLLRPSSSNVTSEKSSLINYLSGEPMSRVDETNFIHNLATISPSSSIIEALNTVGMTTKPAQKLKLSDKLNSIRVKISQVELNAAGQLETQTFMNKNRLQKCVLKCVVTSKCFKSDEDVRLISSVFETAPKRISFSKEITQRFSTPKNSDKFNAFMNFGFCVKPIEQQTAAFFVGLSRVDLAEVINASSTFHKKCPIISESDMRIGSVTVKIELGVNELHFGRDLIDSLYSRRENVSVCSDNSTFERPIRVVNQKVHFKSHPSYSNDQCEADRNYENKNVQTEKSSMGSRLANTNPRDGPDDRDTEMVDVEREKNAVTSKVYSGLLFIEGLRNVKDRSPVDYFITYEGFWNECQESTDFSVELVFNYLKQFPVICDDSFLKRVQNNHLELKLWEKSGQSEKWIGSTKVPLHQFFIAFRDVAMIQHLSLNQLPIISIDNWTNFVSPLSSELFCQGKVLLAIGSENQIEYFKLMRNLHNLRLPVKRKSIEVQADEPRPRSSADPNAQMKNKLSAFIESLSQKLPEPSLVNNFHKTPSVVSSAASSIAPEQSQLRKTSELMESLQKALSQPPAAVQVPTSLAMNQVHQSFNSDSSMSSLSVEKVKMLVSIDHASHLPKVVKKKQNRRKNKSPTTPQKTEFEPSAYATFESCQEQFNESSIPDNIVKSHEGFVHCTNVLKSCDPQWNRNFNVHLPLDVFTNPRKRFVVKVWRKVAQDSDMKAAPFEDAVVGFSAIDLSVLLTGLPVLSGYYNIMDFSGRCNGQIKLSLTPLEDLLQYQDSSTSLPVVNSLMNPLNVDVSSSDETGSNLLSRTLKRKFTELDEITQRLKARLFDVTGDENFDPEDEFERDLNTVVDEMDDEVDRDFSWLKTDVNGGSPNDFQSQLDKILDPQPSTSKNIAGSSSTLPTQRQVSGCSNSQPMAIDQLLKKYDLDTLINPNIFKNILDPTLANSDSTPTLNPRPVNSEDMANASGDSGDTTVSSILSNDQIQTIQKAFQKASLADGSDQSSSRKDPDGENYASE